MYLSKKALILITGLVFILIGGGVFYYQKTTLPKGIPIETKGQPTLGYPKATIQIVVFEEPKCSDCKRYNTRVFPKIKRDFIEDNTVLYTVIPVSFLPGSLPAAKALLCVYNQNPKLPNSDLFFTYMDYIYDHQPPEHTDWVNDNKLIKMAEKASPAIHLKDLRKCLQAQAYRDQIAKNTEYARAIMGGRVVTPTLYVDGIKADDTSFTTVKKLISKVKKHKGFR